MRSALAGRRMQWQLAMICLTGVLIAALSVFLISDAVRGAEQMIIGDATRAVEAAAAELAGQGSLRAAQESAWSDVPDELKDVSLRGVSQAVLRSYPGVEGGYWTGAVFLGYSFPTHLNPDQKTDVPVAELRDLEAAAQTARGAGKSTRVIRAATQAVVIAAVSAPGSGLTAWAMKRVTGLGDTYQQRRRWWLAALVLAALVSLAVTLAAAAGFARGVARIKSGLAALESDYQHRLPAESGELGDIAAAVNRMIEKREALEKELRREDRLRAMGRLVAALAHEVRNPLNGMRLTAQLLKRQAAQTSLDLRGLDAIISEVDRLDTLVGEFLAFGKDHPQNIAPLPLRGAIERALKLVSAQAARQGIQVSIEEGAGGARALFDEDRLTQVLLNLLLNAVDAQSGGGWVRVRTERGPGGTVEIRITDSGPPLEPAVQERLFEMFYSNKSGGAGLGLAVSRELMRHMGGELEYDAQQPHATFVVRVRAANHDQAPHPRS